MMDERGSVELAEATDDYIDIAIVQMALCDDKDRRLFEKDYRVGGEIWRVHKFDADPFLSNPHAHCIDGSKRFVGLKMHLGNAELFRGANSTGRFLDKKQFESLINLIRPKFPDIIFPLENN
ncbi:hypothetical protein [Roseibium polysiphoniae]|uniref:Uncharacterized protein n=1 Tax=Roseibium polysiphoniae TaxID=2571221 RepID=A0ABR9C9C5_9HYPH|nr:hypothetical protein [Roseibium polysiphoniae]MBD8876193.1 hypothetical protein [Roseibium polysiphoniae]